MRLFFPAGAFIFILLSFSAAQTKWKIISEELICANPSFNQCHASTIVELSPGKLMTAWFAGTAEGNPDVTIWYSIKENNKWSAPVSIADGVINSKLRYPCWNPVLFKANNKLSLYYKVGPSPRQWWGMVMESTDDGKTWSKPVLLPDEILGPIKNKPIQLTDGTILSPSSKEKNFEDWSVYIELSRDMGVSWQSIRVDDSNTFSAIQPTILQYADGRLQILCRSQQGNIVQSWSNDKGKTWSKLSGTSLVNPNSGIDAVTLKNDKQLVVYNPAIQNTTGVNSRAKLSVAVSVDGIDWKDVSKLEDGFREEYSYPAVIQTKDGKVHITYTYNRKNIKHVILEAL